MFFASLILPVLAVCLIAYFFYYPLPVLFGIVKYSQESDSNPSQVKTIANERDQDDEYETLLALGFKALGTQREIYGFLSTKQPTLIFTHEQLPIVAHLIVNLDEQLYLKMTTSGQDNCILETNSCPNGMEVNEPTFRSSLHNVSNTEDVFTLHMKAMSQWELEGFKPVSTTSLTDVEHQNSVIMEKKPVKRLIRSVCIWLALESLILTVLMPIFFGCATAWIYCFSLKLATSTPLLVLNFISIYVILMSVYLYTTVVKPKRNPKRNALANRSRILTTKQVDIKKVVEGNETRFVLPYRDDPDQKIHALPFAIGSIVSAIAFSFVTVVVGAVQIKLFGVALAIPITLWTIFAGRLILEMAGKSWRVLLSRSIQDLSIKDGQLRSRERQFIIHSHQRCPVDEIVAIHVLPIDKFLSVSPYHGDDAKSDWGVLAIERKPASDDLPRPGFKESLRNLQNLISRFFGLENRPAGYPLHIAACYPLDLVTSLAHELAYEIELDADKVIISSEILNPESDLEATQPEADSESTDRQHDRTGVLVN